LQKKSKYHESCKSTHSCINWLDENDYIHRKEAAKLIAQTNYIGVDEDIITNSLTGVFEYEKGDIRP
jgi:nitrate/nitrite transport system substrate-binding protein